MDVNSMEDLQDKLAELNIVGIIQARMSSKRLPGKVLLDIGGEPMLVRVVERTLRASTVDNVIVATTTSSSDDPVADLCRERGFPFLRGSLNDVLDRYFQAAQIFEADVIVRVTADCPLIDPGLIDHTVAEFLRSGVDFAANRLPPPYTRTYPIGLDVEVCTFQALERAWKEAKERYEREHVMPYFYDVEGRFQILHVVHEDNLGDIRWTVDTEEDLELVRRVYDLLADEGDFTWLDIVALFETDPELAEINAQVKHKNLMDE